METLFLTHNFLNGLYLLKDCRDFTLGTNCKPEPLVQWAKENGYRVQLRGRDAKTGKERITWA